MVAAGCLSKPSAPAATVDAGTVDAGEDAPTVDAGPCPAGQTEFPANMRLRRVTTVANLDVSLGSTSDDVLTWGREPGQAGPGTGSAYAYIQFGEAALNTACYATRLSFGTGNIEPLDVWVGEVTGDAHPDVLLLGHSQSPSTEGYVVRLFRGRADGTLAPTPDERAFVSNVEIGGSLTNQVPVFITAWRPTAPAMGPVEVVIGGLYEPLQAMTIDPAGNLEAARAVALGLPTNDLISYPQEATTRGDQLVILSHSRVYRFEHVGRNQTTSTYASQGTPVQIDVGRPRSARFNQPSAGAPLLGVTNRAGGFALFAVAPGPITAGDPAATVRTLDAPGSASTGNATITDLDLALATLDAGATTDLAVLASSSATTFLHVFPNLRDSGATAFATDPRLAVDVSGGNMLAVGDFDGNPATPVEVLVRSSNLSQASCFHLIGSPSCLVTCDVLSCP